MSGRDVAGAPRPVPAGLTFVSVPIGNARDVTLRALDVLAGAEVLAAEDTRALRRLMEIHGVPLNGRRVRAYHDANGARARPALLAALAEGRSVAYASEAGTPLLADPGFVLAREAIAAGHPVTAAPGPSALTAALAVGGLASDRLLFAGFPPPSAGARAAWLRGLDAAAATVAIYESPRRVRRLLDEMRGTHGEGRRVALCRELTKRFEEVLRGTIAEVSDALTEDPRGEVVLLVERPGEAPPAGDLDTLLSAAMARVRLKEAVAEVAAVTGRPRRDVYAAALALKGAGDG